MKGLEYSGIDLLDTDGDGLSDDEWFNQDPPASPSAGLCQRYRDYPEYGWLMV